MVKDGLTLPLPARRALQAYLESRPPVEGSKVFIGERGPLTDRGVRALARAFGAALRHAVRSAFLTVIASADFRSTCAAPLVTIRKPS
jgi:hypothetical protein